MKNTLAVAQNVRHRVTICSSNSTPKYIPERKKTYVHTQTYTGKFKATLFIIAMSCINQMPLNPWMDEKMWDVHTTVC